jgi:hypothetical protein
MEGSMPMSADWRIFMKLKQFAQKMADRIQKQMGDDWNISATTTIKNNNTEQVGILFQKKNEAIAPTIYLEDLYEKYRTKEFDISQCVEESIERYENSLNVMEDIRKLRVDFEKCKDKIIYRLVSRERNESALEKMPYIPFLDMAITFQLVVALNGNYMQSVKVTDELKKSWGASVELLYKLASENTRRLLPEDVCDIRERLKRFFDGREDGKGFDKDFFEEMDLTKSQKTDMIVISNKFGINGASAMLYEGVIENLAEEYDANLYLLPSSVHEMIAVPSNDPELIDMFRPMVKSINETYVDKDDILSDRVYLYLKEEKRFI